MMVIALIESPLTPMLKRAGRQVKRETPAIVRHEGFPALLRKTIKKRPDPSMIEPPVYAQGA
ncbi:hypothetical protein [Sphingomonas sp. Leaf37]|uniref:hypothetical protein n=1 Tax=Sphingomonas sp. Leaf37 TaxID=2876552 RepID=UPI001E612551|nr:hypothetical protein [Sphingomonas sp. Leaf37]